MVIDETHPAGRDWWGQDSAAIEQSALAARDHGVRTVVLRTGYVLTPDSLSSQVAQFHRHFGPGAALHDLLGSEPDNASRAAQ